MAWTDDIHLGPAEVRSLVWDACADLLIRCPIVVMQAGCDEEAYVHWPADDSMPRLVFAGRGCTLEILAHELAHLMEGPDEPTHGADHHFLKRLLAHYLSEKLNVAGS